MTPLDPTLQAASLALVHFLWQGAILAFGAAAALRLTRAPTARYTIGVATLAAMLAAPLVTSMWIFNGFSSPIRAAALTSEQGTATSSAATELAPRLDTPSAAAAASSTDTALTSAVMQAAVLVIWAGGVLLLSSRLAGGWVVARRLARRSIVAARPDIVVLARRVAGRLALDRAVRVFESSAIAVPMMVGWLKPVVLLPVSALGGLSPTQLEALLAHELAHVRRHDYLVNLLQSAVETLLFYHPAVWWVSRQVRTEREHCCDDLAVTVCDRLVYVSALADLAALTSLTGRPLALAASDGSLLARVQRLLGGRREPRSSGAFWAIGLTALIVVIGGVRVAPWSPGSLDAAALPQAGVVPESVSGPLPALRGPNDMSMEIIARDAVGIEPMLMVEPESLRIAAPQTSEPPHTSETPQTPALLAERAKLAKALAELSAQQSQVDEQTLKERLAVIEAQLEKLEEPIAKRQLSDADKIDRQHLEALTARLKQLAEAQSLEARARATLDQHQKEISEAQRANMIIETKMALEKLQTAAQRMPLKNGGGAHDTSGLYTWSEDGQRALVRWSGPFKIADDDKDIAWVESGKSVDVMDGEGMSVTTSGGADGSITREYRKSGAGADFNGDGRASLARTLEQLISHTGFAADMRVARILRTGGVDAVLKEIDTLKTDSARHAYYVELIHQANLSPADLARIGKKASETIKSPDDLSAVLAASHASEQLADLAATKAALASAPPLKTSDDVDAVLGQAKRGDLTDTTAPRFFGQIAHLPSDRDRADALIALLKLRTLTSTQRRWYEETAKNIQSEADQSRALAALARADGGR